MICKERRTQVLAYWNARFGARLGKPVHRKLMNVGAAHPSPGKWGWGFTAGGQGADISWCQDRAESGVAQKSSLQENVTPGSPEHHASYHSLSQICNNIKQYFSH